MRLDKYISEKFSMTRNRAEFCIDSGLVLLNGKSIFKGAYDVKVTDMVELSENKKTSFVARSAVKLDDFLTNKKIEVKDFICLDVGASTGGFTQVLLQRGARQVTAVDVGTSQLHESLQKDPRVISRENCDIRSATFEEGFDLIVVDVSFISLRKIVPHLQKIASENTRIILLFKPQFEVGKEHLRKTGVPRDEKIIKRALDDFCGFLRERGLRISDVSESTLPGEAGNREWLILIHV